MFSMCPARDQGYIDQSVGMSRFLFTGWLSEMLFFLLVSDLIAVAESLFVLFSWLGLSSAGSVTEQYNPSGQGPEG